MQIPVACLSATLCLLLAVADAAYPAAWDTVLLQVTKRGAVMKVPDISEDATPTQVSGDLLDRQADQVETKIPKFGTQGDDALEDEEKQLALSADSMDGFSMTQ
eukprot:gnl/TRDRNA2_/TRDRNA2_156379_c0_seq3.p1 gnl/TRDRNA2_/TRDRNA2_156379_c0~~gnl/TRDRNA2_/TRDRNA2_156379_c0_seq3.p1  ORF type:complete len:104 (+),score=23.64 gnl/TRDRNA2_/TRDRNA2_156379_c0_seq3:133-444(+)